MKILNYIGENVDGIIFDVDWTKLMSTSTWNGRFDIFKYSLSKGANITKISEINIGSGGNIEMVKYVERIQPINWNELMKGASGSGHEDLVLYALSKGANNYKECMIEASERSHLFMIILLEREIRSKGIHISTAVWNECMKKACENIADQELSDVMDFIKYCGNKGAYDWNNCLKEGARHLCLDVIEYAESKGADDWEESIHYMKQNNSYAMDINDDNDYKRAKRKIIASIEEHFKYKLGMHKRRKL